MTKHVLKCFVLLTFIFTAARAQAPAPESKQVEIFGQKIHYLEAGAASTPAVILLHGLGGDMSNWAMTIPALSGKYHVYVPDQVGSANQISRSLTTAWRCWSNFSMPSARSWASRRSRSLAIRWEDGRPRPSPLRIPKKWTNWFW